MFTTSTLPSDAMSTTRILPSDAMSTTPTLPSDAMSTTPTPTSPDAMSITPTLPQGQMSTTSSPSDVGYTTPTSYRSGPRLFKIFEGSSESPDSLCPSVVHWESTDQQEFPSATERLKFVQVTLKHKNKEPTVWYMHPSCAYDYLLLGLSELVSGIDLSSLSHDLSSLSHDLSSLSHDLNHELTSLVLEHIADFRDMSQIRFGLVVPGRLSVQAGEKSWCFLPSLFGKMSLKSESQPTIEKLRSYYSFNNQKPWEHPLDDDDIRASRLSNNGARLLADSSSVSRGWVRVVSGNSEGTEDQISSDEPASTRSSLVG